MSIVLGGVTLPNGMVWEDRYSFTPIRQETKFTLGGTLVVHSSATTGGKPITLVAAQDQGWLTKVQVDAIQSLAEVEGAVYTLVYGASSYSVIFRHHDNPAIDFSPLIPRAEPLSDDYFTGSIKLMTV